VLAYADKHPCERGRARVTRHMTHVAPPAPCIMHGFTLRVSNSTGPRERAVEGYGCQRK
jgi:hypothetical protein